MRLPAPTPKALYSPCEIAIWRLWLTWNISRQRRSAIGWCFDFRKLDVFSFGENGKRLVGHVHLLYRN
ncbi:hypothetical protein ACNKHX_23665 [Shigella flexneri]